MQFLLRGGIGSCPLAKTKDRSSSQSAPQEPQGLTAISADLHQKIKAKSMGNVNTTSSPRPHSLDARHQEP